MKEKTPANWACTKADGIINSRMTDLAVKSWLLHLRGKKSSQISFSCVSRKTRASPALRRKKRGREGLVKRVDRQRTGKGAREVRLPGEVTSPLLVVEDFQRVDLSFSLDRGIFIFPTEYSRYHLKA